MPVPLFTLFRMTLAGLVMMLLAWMVLGCTEKQSAAPSVRQRLAVASGDAVDQGDAEEDAADDAGTSATRRKTGRPVATVNGEPIERRALVQLLVEAKGLGVLQQMILEELARQETAQAGLTVTAADVEQEYDLTLVAARFNGKDPEKLTPARREQLIDEWTRTRGVSREELAIVMRRQAHLRKIVEPRIEITDKMLRDEFARVHGEKVEVRHIQLAAARVWPQIKERLDRGDRFEDLVADFSQNTLSRERRGLLPPFSEHDSTVPAIFAKVAFSLEPGEVSNPIEAEGSLHVLKLERRLPAEDVSFDAAEKKLRRNLHARLVAEAMEHLGSRLLGQSELRIEDSVLRDQYKRLQASGEIPGPPLLGQ